MIESRLVDGVVVTCIPAGTSKVERARIMAEAHRLGKGASIGRKYKTNWADYHKKKNAIANQVRLGL